MFPQKEGIFVHIFVEYDLCSDSIRLQQTVEELQIRLVTLEKKTADYESLQAELEEKQVHFLGYQF